MKAILFICSAAFLLASGVMVTAADSIPRALSKTEGQFLDNVRALNIGMSENELRTRFPDLGVLKKPENRNDHRELLADFPVFKLAGLEWSGYAEFAGGKLVRVSLGAGAYSEPTENERLAIPRHHVRKAGLLIAAHFQHSIGEVTERYVPNVDCPAGNPYGLRHTWRTKGKALLVEFGKVSSHSSVMIELADWVESQREQKELYESAWPLKPAPRALLREVAGSR